MTPPNSIFSRRTSIPIGSLPAESADSGIAYRLPASASPVLSSLFRDDAADVAAREDAIRAKLAARAFDFNNPPPKPRAVFKFDDKTISTPGNLTLIQGPVKAGKSAVMAAMMAAVLNGNRQGPDTLGFSSENATAWGFIHFDTEQSPHDSDALIRRSMERARVSSLPAWFHSFALADLDTDERKAALAIAMKDAAANHGGIHAVLIDGVADLCVSPNDETEAFGLVASLHSAAITYDCPVIAVIHENPGNVEGKTRGHLGSQLARKAETPLRLHKDEAKGITTVWADRARHCHIPRSEGLCFQYSAAAGMHVSCGSVREIRAEANRSKFADEADRAFGDEESLSYTDLLERVAETANIAVKTAETRLRAYRAEGLVRKRKDGKYVRGDGLPSTLKLPSKTPPEG
jgi:hypothetical protein